MEPTSATGSNATTPRPRTPTAGFTLLEVLITLGIAALVVAIALPALRPSPVADLKSGAQLVAAALRQTRLDAMDSGHSRALLVNTEARTLQAPGSDTPKQLPGEPGVKLSTADREMRNPHLGGIRFWPDGSATGGRVTLDKAGLSVRVDVEWLTGRVRISEVEGG
jgi:general secretion pathway protein H